MRFALALLLIALVACDDSRSRGRGGPSGTNRSDASAQTSDSGSDSGVDPLGKDAASDGGASDALDVDATALDATSPDAIGERDATSFDAANRDATSFDATSLDATSPDAMEPPGAGLAAWWRFEETSGSVIDSSGNGHHGTVFGSVSRGVSGRFGSAISFDGSGNGWVVVPASPGLDFISAGTIELWVRIDSGGGVGSTVSRGTGNNDDNLLQNTSCGNMQTIFSRSTSGGGTTNVTNDCGDITLGVWTHIAVVNNGSTLSLYLNGALDRTDGGGFMGPLFTDLWFGLREQHIFPFHGALDEIKWWTVARTQAEICGDAGGSWNGSTCAL